MAEIDYAQRSVKLKYVLRQAVFSLEYALDSMPEDSINTRQRRASIEREFNTIKAVLAAVEDEDARQQMSTDAVLKDCVLHRDLAMGRR